MSGHCNFCGIWHSGSCCHPGRPIPTQPFAATAPSRPSDRSISQAYLETLPADYADIGVDAFPVLARARELDATAAPVVVGEDAILAAMRPYLDEADGGYCCDVHSGLVVAAGRAAIALAGD